MFGLDDVAGGVLAIGGKLIDRLIPDPTQKAQAQLELLRLQQNGELEEMRTSMSAIIAEAQSQDKLTSRARPAFLYVFYIIVLTLVLFAPLVGIFFPLQMHTFYDNVTMGFKAIPEPLWWTFTTGYLGYSAVRSYDKKIGAK